jgi:tRNA (mo5U34)-methyltransferase
METLIVEGDKVLYPEGRYARMRNIGAIPDIGSLVRWMGESGFQNIQIVDVSTTGLDEQRSTSWMQFESLDKALDPSDLSKTVEGLPGPRRAMLIGERR